MALKPGTKLGPYEILSQIGTGGMGEVYKARDTRLNRIDAIKVLPAHLAERAELRERFQREAETIASLKHPHICVLYNIGQEQLPQGRTDYLVMEYLEGETLAQRLNQSRDRQGATARPLPLDQILQYAIEIADALDKAHRKGVTHRDIKPGNIMLVKEGSGWSTKLLDFGLAKLKQDVQSRARQQADFLDSQAPTPPLGAPQIAGTVEGNILGTVQYMVPEQAEGKKDEIDARTDIFSFGAMLYEMVTGTKAFHGQSHVSLISSIMKDQPPSMSSLAPMTPPALDRVVKQCLAKDPDERWQTASDLCRELRWIKDDPQAASATPAVPVDRTSRNKKLLGSAVGALVFGLLVGIFIWKLRWVPAARVTRTVISIPAGDRLETDLRFPVVLSPNGAFIAYVAVRRDVRQVYLRALNEFEARPVAGTEGLSDGPFFSPDSEWIGFFSHQKMQKASVNGGTPLVICETLGGPNSASWSADDTIYFSPRGGAGIWRVPASGGTPHEWATVDSQKGEVSHLWPEVLSTGNAVLFTVVNNSSDDEIVAQVIKTGERRAIIKGNAARYVRDGHVIYMNGATLMAAAFDPAKLEITGTPVPVLEGVSAAPSGIGFWSASEDGTLAYVAGGVQSEALSRFVWVDRRGTVQALTAPPRHYGHFSLSPNGERVAVGIQTGVKGDIWVYNIRTGNFTRLTFSAFNRFPIWTADGTRVCYQVTRGRRSVFCTAADGNGTEEQLTKLNFENSPFAWSPDGKTLIHTWHNRPGDYPTLGILSLSGERTSRSLDNTATGSQGNAGFSPDGHWLLYASTESGRSEVYARAFPGPGGKWQVSNAGGDEPRWASSGKELFYREGRKLMVADVTSSPAFTVSAPRLLFEGDFLTGSNPTGYLGVAPDAQHFLMLQSVESPEEQPTKINLVLNWFEDLKKKVPGK